MTLNVVTREICGTDLLGDTTCFSSLYISLSQFIKNECFSSIYVTQNTNDRAPHLLNLFAGVRLSISNLLF